MATAYAAWINDSFWLNPVVKLRDEGVTVSLVQVERAAGPARGRLVEYASGGLTPGDAYLWIVGDDGRPIAWQMWVSVLPIGGAEATWSGWTELDTGAWVSTAHAMGPVHVALTGVAAAPTVGELEPGPDPFAALLGG